MSHVLHDKRKVISGEERVGDAKSVKNTEI